MAVRKKPPERVCEAQGCDNKVTGPPHKRFCSTRCRTTLGRRNGKPVGRPRVIQTPEEFNDRVDAYFQRCFEDDEPVMLTGLILALGLCSREALEKYEERAEYTDSVKRAMTMVQSAYERRMHGTTPTGAIFALKNLGWKDSQEVVRKDETVHDPDKLAEAIGEFFGRLGMTPPKPADEQEATH